MRISRLRASLDDPIRSKANNLKVCVTSSLAAGTKHTDVFPFPTTRTQRNRRGHRSLGAWKLGREGLGAWGADGAPRAGICQRRSGRLPQGPEVRQGGVLHGLGSGAEWGSGGGQIFRCCKPSLRDAKALLVCKQQTKLVVAIHKHLVVQVIADNTATEGDPSWKIRHRSILGSVFVRPKNLKKQRNPTW